MSGAFKDRILVRRIVHPAAEHDDGRGAPERPTPLPPALAQIDGILRLSHEAVSKIEQMRNALGDMTGIDTATAIEKLNEAWAAVGAAMASLIAKKADDSTRKEP